MALDGTIVKVVYLAVSWIWDSGDELAAPLWCNDI